jgi:hypothetical protein
MKVVLDGMTNASELIEVSRDRFKENSFLNFVSQNVIISGSNVEFSECIKNICKQPDVVKMAKIVELYKRIPFTEKRSNPPVDFSLGHDSELKLSEIALEKSIVNLCESRQPLTQRGTLRKDLYTSVIKPFATSAKGVFILDPYVIENFMENADDSLEWVFSQLIADGILFANIYSRRWNANQRFEYELNDIKSKMHKVLNKYRVNNPDFRLKLILGSSKHMDRHFRFYYSSERITPTISFGKGLGVFESERLKSAHSINAENPRNAQQREIEIEHSRGKSNLDIFV